MASLTRVLVTQSLFGILSVREQRSLMNSLRFFLVGFCGRCLVIGKSEGFGLVIQFEGFPVYIYPMCLLSLSSVLYV